MRNLVTLGIIFIVLSNKEDDFLITTGKAGRISISMTIDELYKNYDRKLINLTDLFLEGYFTPALEIYLDKKTDKPSLVVEIGWANGWSVSRINVYDKKFHTEKGIKVGSTLKDLRKNYNIEWISSGETHFCAYVQEIGISFLLDSFDIPLDWYKNREMKLIPDSAKIISILII